MTADPADAPTRVVGWREWIGLPGLGVDWLKAKIDTGAQTSSLHAFGTEEFVRDGTDWVRFEIHPLQRNARDAVWVELPVHDRRRVRSSNGLAQDRFVVLMDVRLLDRVITAEVTLTRRDAMGYRMLIGREALAQGFMVDSRVVVSRQPTTPPDPCPACRNGLVGW
ncbi:ATP-dependent zinc protease [Microlunatus sp. Gsoil 973]|uniref:ATP-dependent zinc protease family protein n=1 Tax=Microlunatus sp. Gsoil 973 TaxID=2672569 RepID=UPI001E64BBD7|nr:ATP-dependent zinc protease [Microlunatus sp. Gsoil 973]